MLRRRRLEDIEVQDEGLGVVSSAGIRPTRAWLLRPRFFKSHGTNPCLFRISLRRLVLVLAVAILVGLGLHELYFFVALHRIEIYKHRRRKYLPPIVPMNQAKVGVVSLHRGIKFAGYLGKWLGNNKALYARRHGYAYADEAMFPATEEKLEHLAEWQLRYKRRIKFDKLRFLLYLMETNQNLRYVLWMDADAIITQPDIRVEDRIGLFRDLYNEQQAQPEEKNFCFVWAADDRPNTGILLFTNTPVTRSLIKQSLATFSEKQIFMDQASFTAAVKANETYSSCQLLLRKNHTALLQSRVRGKQSQKWKLGDWIMHLPNHNRLEIVRSLSAWLPHIGDQTGSTGTASCQPLTPLGPPDLSSLSERRKARYEAVREAVRFAWKSYSSAALHSQHFLNPSIPADDLSPVSKTGHSWLYYAATLHDAVDTLYIANLTTEYKNVVSFLTSSDLQTTSLRPTKTFEYSLRILGGLLGAYSLSGDVRLVAAARNAADALLDGPFRASPTVLPRMYDVLAPPTSSSWKASIHRVYAGLYRWGRDAFTKEHHVNSLAGVGSFGLEFSFLTRATQDWAYRDASDAIFDFVTSTTTGGNAEKQRVVKKGTVPTLWNVMTGRPLSRGGTIGSGSDSFYEYLLKIPMLNGCGKRRDMGANCLESDREMMSTYRKMLDTTLRSNHVLATNKTSPQEHTSMERKVSYPVDNGNVFHHLLCFVPGMIALGEVEMGNDLNSKDMNLARELLRGCHDAYQRTGTGLGAEQVRIGQPSGHHRSNQSDTDRGAHFYASNPSYLLRPEYVESLFIMYRITKDEGYQDLAWEVFQSLNKYCKVDGGFAGLRDVYDPSNGHFDDMPSYFIAETLKYLLLLFGPNDYVSLDEYVFTTEAHPIRRIRNDQNVLCTDDANKIIIPVPVPWFLIGCVLCVFFGMTLGSYILFRMCSFFWRKRGQHKPKDT